MTRLAVFVSVETDDVALAKRVVAEIGFTKNIEIIGIFEKPTARVNEHMVGELAGHLAQYDPAMKVGPGDDFGDLEPIDGVSLYKPTGGEEYVHLEIVRGTHDVD